MKPDGVTMETTEPTEAAAIAEPSLLQDNITEQASSQPEEAANEAAPTVAPKAGDKQGATNPKTKQKSVETKIQPKAKNAWVSGSNSRPGTASHSTGNNVKSSNSVSSAAAKKTVTKAAAAAAAAAASAAGAVPKKHLGTSAVSTKNQTRVPDKKLIGPTRTTSVAAATATNSTKPVTVNGTPKKKPMAETVNVARPKTTVAACRPAVSSAPKPSTSTTTKAVGGAVSRTTRPATAPSTTRPASTTARPTTAMTKPSTSANPRTTASRVTLAPSAGRTTAAQPSKPTATAKKDVGGASSASVAKKPATATLSTGTKKPEPSKPTATVKLNSASKMSATAKAADPKKSQSKTSQPAKTATKPVAAVRFPAVSKPPLGRTPPASPLSRPANGSTSHSKRGTKPTQAVQPFTAVNTKSANATQRAVEARSAAVAAVAAVAVAAVSAAETQAEAEVTVPQESPRAASAPEEVPPVSAQDPPPDVMPQETVQSHTAAPSPPQSPISTASPVTSPPQHQLESSAPLSTVSPTSSVASPQEEPLCEEHDYLLTNQTSSTSKAAANVIPQMVPPISLNEDEDEEEREGSQLISVSEMSGTTQPTEESRPGSAGPVGGSAWRAGGALFSELDSEDVSGSQQGASELSAPGVLEGTESMDDLGEGSLKGAIDMEGASAGSPDFEKVPDIPVNDFEEEEDDDDNDRVCDMDVGSERTDDLLRPRHDNDVDDEDDEDVEMASEGVTESGLESYGNADEDDFAEDERLDNLNRVAQPPPPPPLLPSAPAAQWDQPNPFADPWEETVQPLQVPELMGEVAGAAAVSPSANPWQADSEAPTQTPAQAWLELSTTPFVVENQDVAHHSSVKGQPQNPEAQLYLDQFSPAPMQTLPLAPLSAPGMSLSSTVSSETSTPEELCDYNREDKLQPQDAHATEPSPQPDPCIHSDRGEEDGEEEAETLPADEVLGGPATAPTSNPSSSSVTEDEASDTEGEAQLDDSLERPALCNITFDSQLPAQQRCLSTVEEGEEAETEGGGAGGDATPPSATSLASYGFDTMTTASNSNAHSTGESCIKSPGIFSLEELPEEAKEPCLIPQPLTQSSVAEHQYIECGKQEPGSAELEQEEARGSEESPSSLCSLQKPEDNPDDIQPPYYSAICEKTENSFAGFTALPHPHRRDHVVYPRNYCDIAKPLGTSVTPPKLTCADLPPRSPGQQALSPQLRRLEQHQRQLLELQHRREQQSRPLEEAEQERKRREEEEQRKKKEEAEEEIKRNKEEERQVSEQAEIANKEEEEEEELKQRRDLELQLQQQQEELKQRQQIMQWQQELQQSNNKGQAVLLSPTSGLCTIYETLENSDPEDTEDEEEEMNKLNSTEEKREPEEETLNEELDDISERVTPDKEICRDSLPSTKTPSPPPDAPDTPSYPSQDRDCSSPSTPESPERPSPLELDWGKKVDIVQHLINQTLLLNGDGCSSLLLMPGGAGGTLSPLESSLWPSLLPPLTPPSATVTSVSSFSPEATGSSPQGEWTVVELETHH